MQTNGKLPVCSKVKKTGFPVKPQCLKLTTLENLKNESRPASRSFTILAEFNSYPMESYSKRMPEGMEQVSYLQPAAHSYKFYARNML